MNENIARIVYLRIVSVKKGKPLFFDRLEINSVLFYDICIFVLNYLISSFFALLKMEDDIFKIA